MSKILQALEKAQRDGDGEGDRALSEGAAPVSPVAAPPVEIETGSPAGRPTADVPGPRRKGSTPVLMDHLPSAVRPGSVPGDLSEIEAHVECLHRPLSVVAEAYRGLRSRLERQLPESASRVIAVTSAVQGEGKSVTAVNLAITLAQDADRRVLLVDADMRRPRVHDMLGLVQAPGLGDLLAGRAAPSAVIQRLDGVGLDVVAVGELDGHPGELLAGAALAEALGRWRRSHDFILLDTPPVHPISDVAFLSEVVDGYLVVVRARKTSKEVLEQLGEHIPCEKILGAILNRSEVLPGRYGYGKKGYGYGCGEG